MYIEKNIITFPSIIDNSIFSVFRHVQLQLQCIIKQWSLFFGPQELNINKSGLYVSWKFAMDSNMLITFQAYCWKLRNLIVGVFWLNLFVMLLSDVLSYLGGFIKLCVQWDEKIIKLLN